MFMQHLASHSVCISIFLHIAYTFCPCSDIFNKAIKLDLHNMQKPTHVMNYHEIHLCENSALSFSYIHYNAWILCGNSTDFELIYTSSVSDLINMQIYFSCLQLKFILIFTHILQENNILDMTSHKFKKKLELTHFSLHLSNVKTFRLGPNKIENDLKIPEKLVKRFLPTTDSNLFLSVHGLLPQQRL